MEQKDTNYLTAAFRETVAQRFPAQAAELTARYDARLARLWAENADAPEALRFHYERQILPGIAVYETLQTVLSKEDALRTVHGYVEGRAHATRRRIDRLMRLPGLYLLTPGIFARMTKKLFGPTAGFAATDRGTARGVWRIDMTRCPYHDACARYGCPELCHCFCDSDDITYDGLHPKLLWRRTKTLGRGDDCCDFCLMLRGKDRAGRRAGA